MLHDVFPVIQSLNLVLQKASGSICLTDISVYLEKTINSLEKFKTASQRSHFRENKNDIFVKSAVTETLNFPPGAGTYSNLQFDLCKFEEKVFILFSMPSQLKSMRHLVNLISGCHSYLFGVDNLGIKIYC